MARRKNTRQPTKAFEGPLAEAIETRRMPLWLRSGSDDEKTFLRDWSMEIACKRFAKLPLLMEHYQIPETLKSPVCFVLLALQLATDFVPGFKLDIEAPPRKGRPRKYDKYALFTLLLRVDGYKALDPSLTDLAACQQVVTEDNPVLAKSGRATERRQRARTLANLLAKARDPSLNPHADALRPLIEALRGQVHRHGKST
jgi:hypothetical protein